MNKMKYIDQEEKEMIESLKDLDIDHIENDTDNIKNLQKSAKQYFRKQDTTITLRISKSEVEKIKKAAARNGLRYQTFLKSIIHKYL